MRATPDCVRETRGRCGAHRLGSLDTEIPVRVAEDLDEGRHRPAARASEIDDRGSRLHKLLADVKH